MTTLSRVSQAGIAEHAAKQPKVFLMAAGEFLHWSGLVRTTKRSLAWTGTIEQARKARSHFDAAAGLKAIPIHKITPPQHFEEVE